MHPAIKHASQISIKPLSLLQKELSFGCRGFRTLLLPHYFCFPSLWLRVSLLYVCQTRSQELLFNIQAWERYLKCVNFRNQILFTDGVQAGGRDPGPRSCGSWITYKLLMSFTLRLDELPTVFRHIKSLINIFFPISHIQF